MNSVIVIIEGYGAFRCTCAFAEEMLAVWEGLRDRYVIDSQGRTWAPSLDSWILWSNCGG